MARRLDDRTKAILGTFLVDVPSLPHEPAKVSRFAALIGELFPSTQDVRNYAAQKHVDEDHALEVGMKEKAEEFRKAGAEIYR